MGHFTDAPAAVDYVASQSWLSPDEPVAFKPVVRPRVAPIRRLSPSQAYREIAGILRRTRLSVRK